jgi:hypothetical protein
MVILKLSLIDQRMISYSQVNRMEQREDVSYFMSVQIPSTWLPRQLKFIWWCLIFAAQFLLFSPYIHKVNQFICTKQKAPDNSDVHRSLQNCGSSVWNLLHVTLLVPKIWTCPQILGRCLDPWPVLVYYSTNAWKA